jgi:hypothetical protein
MQALEANTAGVCEPVIYTRSPDMRGRDRAKQSAALLENPYDEEDESDEDVKGGGEEFECLNGCVQSTFER